MQLSCSVLREVGERSRLAVSGFLLVFWGVIMQVHFFCRRFNEEGRLVNNSNFSWRRLRMARSTSARSTRQRE